MGKQTQFVSDVWGLILRVWNQPCGEFRHTQPLTSEAECQGCSSGFHIPHLQLCTPEPAPLLPFATPAPGDAFTRAGISPRIWFLEQAQVILLSPCPCLLPLPHPLILSSIKSQFLGFVLQIESLPFSHLCNWCYLLRETLQLQPARVRRS